MNYASVVFAGFATISVVWYFAYARRHFTGPPVMADLVDEVGSDSPGVGVTFEVSSALKYLTMRSMRMQHPRISHKDKLRLLKKSSFNHAEIPGLI